MYTFLASLGLELERSTELASGSCFCEQLTRACNTARHEDNSGKMGRGKKKSGKPKPPSPEREELLAAFGGGNRDLSMSEMLAYCPELVSDADKAHHQQLLLSTPKRFRERYPEPEEEPPATPPSPEPAPAPPPEPAHPLVLHSQSKAAKIQTNDHQEDRNLSMSEMAHGDTVELELAVLSMGCFWKAEAELGGLPGVIGTDVGYVQGVEAARCKFNPSVTSYSDILDLFDASLSSAKNWKNRKYTSCVYPRSEAQSVMAVERFGLGTLVQPMKGFKRANADHQKYYLGNTKHGKRYKQRIQQSGANSLLLARANHCAERGKPFKEDDYLDDLEVS